LRPGAWLKELKESLDSPDAVVIDGITRSKEELRKLLLVETPGDSIAYLTDFLLDEPATERMTDALRGCRVLVCEGQYRHSDLDLAKKHFHMTTTLSATLANRAQVEELILFHLSSRYQAPEWLEMLREAGQIFPHVHYPRHWNLELAG